jgi:hypothetical protein
MKMAVFWVGAPCSTVKLTDVSEVLTLSIMRVIMTEAASTSETSVDSHQSTLRTNPEDSHLRSLSRSQEHVEVAVYL